MSKMEGKQNKETDNIFSCSICYIESKDKVTLECQHELCVKCFIEMNRLLGEASFKCHMCRKQYKWKNDFPCMEHNATEDTIELLIREDEDNLFLPLIGKNSKTFEVIIKTNNSSSIFNLRQNIVQFVVILGRQIDTETLKFLISEYVVNRVTDDLRDIIENLRGSNALGSAFSHFRKVTDENIAHLETFYDNLVIKNYE